MSDIDVARLADWMDGEALPGKGEPLEARFLSGGTQNVIYELRRGEESCVLRMPPPGAPPDRDKGILREWRIIEALDGTDVPHTKAVGVCSDASVLGRPFYLMGFVDGWSPMDQHGKWPEPFDSDLSSRPGLSYQLAEGIALLSKVDWQAKGLQDLGRPDGFHERQVDRWIGFLERIKKRELPGLDVATDWLRAHKPLDYIPGPDARRLPVRQRHVPARRASAVGSDRRLGDGHGRRPEAGSRLDGAIAGPVDDGAGGLFQRDELRRHARHAVARRRSSRITPKCRVAKSTTWTTTWCWPSGSWRSCWSRASSVQATTRSCSRTAPSSRN